VHAKDLNESVVINDDKTSSLHRVCVLVDIVHQTHAKSSSCIS